MVFTLLLFGLPFGSAVLFIANLIHVKRWPGSNFYVCSAVWHRLAGGDLNHRWHMRPAVTSPDLTRGP